MLYFTHPACLRHEPAPAMPGHPERPERLLADRERGRRAGEATPVAPDPLPTSRAAAQIGRYWEL